MTTYDEYVEARLSTSMRLLGAPRLVLTDVVSNYHTA
jgi:hypothetical protein